MQYYDDVAFIDAATDVIMHHGVKGQRWGVRRYRPYESGERRPQKAQGQLAGGTKRRGGAGKRFLGATMKAARSPLAGVAVTAGAFALRAAMKKSGAVDASTINKTTAVIAGLGVTSTVLGLKARSNVKKAKAEKAANRGK